LTTFGAKKAKPGSASSKNIDDFYHPRTLRVEGLG